MREEINMFAKNDKRPADVPEKNVDLNEDKTTNIKEEVKVKSEYFARE
jgi:hypothetical protein